MPCLLNKGLSPGGVVWRNDRRHNQSDGWIDDLRHTGRYQVRCVQLVGAELSHLEQVRWARIYDWNGKRFVESDAKYPEAARDTKKKVLVRLQHYPQDPALLKCLAEVYLLEGRKRLARTTLHKLERACLERVKNDPQRNRLVVESGRKRSDKRQATSSHPIFPTSGESWSHACPERGGRFLSRLLS